MNNDLSVQMKKGILELCVLALVAKKECYGYELAEVLADKMDSSIGTIYPILRKMKNAQLLTTKLSDVSGGPPRKYYYITEQGRRVLMHEAGNWRKLSNVVDTFIKE